MATTLTLVTVVGVPIFIALLTLFIAPWVSRRQTDRRLRETEAKQALKEQEAEIKQSRKEQEAAEREIIKERARQEASVEYLAKIVNLRESFAVEIARQKQITDAEMDRANAEIARAKERIDRLSDSLEEVRATLAQALASRQ
jgi:lipopolysaccharide export LptBFGC system permease protein LptF